MKDNTKSRIGLLGGSFNPIHLGHLIQAETARQKLNLDKVFFIPLKIPPHKSQNNLIEENYRVEMVKLAIKDNPFFELSLKEIERDGISYSIITVEEFIRAIPQAYFFFIMGIDAFKDINTWKDYVQLLEMVSFIITTRAEFDEKIFNQTIEKFVRPYLPSIKIFYEPLPDSRFKLEKGIYFIKMPEIGISGSYIRNLLAQGLSIKYLVHDEVEKYIKENRIYINTELKSINGRK